MDSIFISSEIELNNIKNNTRINYICIKCGKQSTKILRFYNRNLLCKQCKTRQFCREHYGTDWMFQNKDVKEKIKKTMLKNGGYTYQRKSAFDKAKETLKQRYNVDHPMKSEYLKNKLYNTNYERYGTKIASQNTEVKLKIKETNIRKYNSETTLNLPQVKNARENVNLKKYGNINPFYTELARKQKYYKYNNIYFDSSWELAFYIYYIDHNISIIREPLYFEYIENNKLKKYYPDFEVNGNLYEIKGDQFFNEKGEPYCKLTKKYWYEKYNCMIDNHVNILKQKDIKKYLIYVNNKYGSKYIRQFKITRN